MTVSLPASAIDENLAALAEIQSPLAEILSRAPLPVTLRPARGRDGSETMVWNSTNGQINWLGRTSMPTISAPALLESFDPGMGNVLLYTFGQGEEVARLLKQLHPHQAIFVIEPSIDFLRAALELRSFAAAIRAGRVCIFAGEDAWTAMQNFLEVRRGFLIPQRILGRPWFDHSLIHELRQRLTELTNEVNQTRATPVEMTPKPTCGQPTLGIISNLVSEEIREWADNLADAAARIGWRACRFVLDDPSMVEPAAIQSALTEANCAAMLVIGVIPDSLAYSLPAVSTAILTTPDNPTPEWCSRIPSHYLVASPRSQSTSSSRQNIYLPIAVPDRCAEMRAVESGESVAIVADFVDIAAETVGLTLASHQHLWRAADELFRRGFSRYIAEEPIRAADLLLVAAEEKLGFKLRSPEVRQGLTDRMASMLIPGIFRERLIEQIKRAGHDVIRAGCGWNEENCGGDEFRPWMGLDEQAWRGIGFVLIPSDSSRNRSRALCAAAIGIPVILGGRPRQHEADDPIQLIPRFCAPNDALRQLNDLPGKPGSAIELRKQLLDRHTWSVRLKSILAKLRETAVRPT